METPTALAIAGAAGVALFFVARRTAAPAAPAVPQSAPNKNPGSGSSVGGLVQAGGTFVGNVVGGAAGLGPVSGAVGQAAGNFASAEYGAWKQAGSGFVDIAHGDVWGGTKNIVSGGIKTAAAPITSTISTVKGWLW